MPPKPKRPRLDAIVDVLHTGGISVAGLQELLSRLAKSEHDVRGIARPTLRSASRALFDQHKVAVSAPLADGSGNFEWPLLAPDTWLLSLLTRSADLADLYATALARRPPTAATPWSLVVAFDEFSPGNKLQVDNRRSGRYV